MQYDKGEYKLMPPKGNKVRAVRIGQLAVDVLRKQKRMQAEWRLRAGSAWCDDGFVFTDEAGGFIKTYTFWEHYKAAVTAIGSADANVHTLRHTFGTTSMQSMVDPNIIQENMGHFSATFTLEQYAHAMPDVQKENAACLDATFSGIISKQK